MMMDMTEKIIVMMEVMMEINDDEQDESWQEQKVGFEASQAHWEVEQAARIQKLQRLSFVIVKIIVLGYRAEN